MKKADPVSSKSLYRRLRVLDVFVYIIIIAKKMSFVKISTKGVVFTIVLLKYASRSRNIFFNF